MSQISYYWLYTLLYNNSIIFIHIGKLRYWYLFEYEK